MEQIQTLVLNPLKPYLHPITTNLPTPINDFVISLLGAPCHSALLLDLDITAHPECLSLAISKALGIAIITTASIVKVPQILKLLTSRSAQGLSLTSYLLESTSFLITLAYNIRNGFPFSTYGEISLILAQDIIITALIMIYSNKGKAGTAFKSGQLQATAFIVGVASAIYALIVSDTLVSSSQMATLQASAGVLGIASKLPPIITVYQQGGTGQLSAFAVFNYLLGSAARVYTTLQEVPDKLILYGFMAGFVLNAVLALQMVYYWNSPTTAKHAAEVDKKEKLIGGVGQDSTASQSTQEKLGHTTARPGSSSGRRRG